MWKKIAAIVISICMIITMIPITALAQTYSTEQLYWIWDSDNLAWDNGMIHVNGEHVFDECWLDIGETDMGYFVISKGDQYYEPVVVSSITPTTLLAVIEMNTETHLYKIKAVAANEVNEITTVTASVNDNNYSMDFHTRLASFGLFSSATHSADYYLGSEIDYSCLKEEGKELYFHALETVFSDDDSTSFPLSAVTAIELGEYNNQQFDVKYDLLNSIVDCGVKEGNHAWGIQIPDDYQGTLIWDEGRGNYLRVQISYEGMAEPMEFVFMVWDHIHDSRDNCEKCMEGRLFWFWGFDESIKWNATHTKIMEGMHTDYMDFGGGAEPIGYFTYFDGEGYVPVKGDNSEAIGFEIVPVGENSDYLYSVSFPIGEIDGTVTSEINGVTYSIQLQSSFPHCGFFRGNERKEEDYINDSIDLSSNNRTFYYLAPDRGPDASLGEYWFIDQYENRIDGNADSGIVIKEPQNNGKGSYYWEITVKDGFEGNWIEEDGRGIWLSAGGEYSDGDGHGGRILLYDHKHEGPLANCSKCSAGKILWVWNDKEISVETDENGLPVLRGNNIPYSISDYMWSPVGSGRTGYFAYFDNDTLRPINIEINDGKTTVVQDAFDEPYLTKLSFAQEEYEIPLEFTYQEKTYSNNISVCLPLAGFYTQPQRTAENYCRELFGRRNESTYYLISDDFNENHGQRDLYFDGQIVPAYQAGGENNPVSIKGIRITPMEYNTWKFEITDEYRGEYIEDLQEGKAKWFGFRMVLDNENGNSQFEDEILIFDKYVTTENQLFFIDRWNVNCITSDGIIVPENMNDVRMSLTLEPKGSRDGYFAYYNGADFVAVDPEIHSDTFSTNFSLYKADEEADPYWYYIESISLEGSGTLGYGDYSLEVSAQLPEVGFYKAPQRTIENYCNEIFGEKNNGVYYLIEEGFFEESMQPVLSIGDMDIPCYSVNETNASVNVNGILITPMPNNIWKFEITEAYRGEHEGNVLNGKYKWYEYELRADGWNYATGIRIYDKHSTAENQLFFIDRWNVECITPAGIISPENLNGGVRKSLTLDPMGSMEGYFAYHNGIDFVAVNPDAFSEEFSANFRLSKANEEKDPYWYYIESLSLEGSGTFGYGIYSINVSVQLPEVGFYKALQKTKENFCGELFGNKNDGTYYMILDRTFDDSDCPVLYFDNEEIPGYSADATNAWVNVKGIKITPMANNTWKFEITDDFQGEYDGNVLEGNMSCIDFCVEANDYGYQSNVCVYDKHNTIENQLFFIDSSDVAEMTSAGIIAPENIYYVSKTLTIYPYSRREGYFAYYDGNNFLAVKPDTFSSDFGSYFNFFGAEDDEYLYTIETIPLSGSGTIGWANYSITASIELPEVSFYSSLAGTTADYCDEILYGNRNGGTYYLIEKGFFGENERPTLYFDNVEIPVYNPEATNGTVTVRGIEITPLPNDTWKFVITDEFHGDDYENVQEGMSSWIAYSVEYGNSSFRSDVTIYDKYGVSSNQALVSGITVVGKKNEEIAVEVNLEKNPGLASMLLTLEYNGDVLEFIGAENGEIFPDGSFLNPGTTDAGSKVLSWQNSTLTENISQTGRLATITFKIKDTAQQGEQKIHFLCDYEKKEAINVHGESIDVMTRSAAIYVVEYGDIDRNNRVDTADAFYLRRHLAGWKAYEDIVTYAADVDKDGMITIRDLTILERHIASWSGYETFPITAELLPGA